MSKYKASDKVVVDIKDTYLSAYGIKCYGLNGIGDYSAERIDEKTEPLSTYTEPLESKIRRQSEEITRLLRENNELKEQMKFDLPTLISEEDRRRMDINKARAEGQNEAWELARKCMLMTDREREAIFGSGHNALYGVLTYFDYKHADAKVSSWEKAKEEIKVGDIVRNRTTGYESLVTCVTEHSHEVFIIYDNGVTESCDINVVEKTGRHIDIDSFLKQIGEE